MAQFERSADKLEEDAESSKELNPTDITLALNNAAAIDDFLKRYTLPARTRRDWARVKANLDDLAFINRVAWDWSRRSKGQRTRQYKHETQIYRSVCFVRTQTAGQASRRHNLLWRR
jgi:hypothetical protein